MTDKQPYAVSVPHAEISTQAGVPLCFCLRLAFDGLQKKTRVESIKESNPCPWWVLRIKD